MKDHRSLIALFGPTIATPALAANRLARWLIAAGALSRKARAISTCRSHNEKVGREEGGRKCGRGRQNEIVYCVKTFCLSH